MFNQVLKQLWNARRSNAWIWAVLLVVSVLLWFALDIIYNYEAAARKPLGYDVDGLYNIELRYNWTTNADSTQDEDNRAIYNLIKDYPLVDKICYYRGDEPFSDNRMYEGFTPHSDSTFTVSTFIRLVSPEFFDVYNVTPIYGSIDSEHWSQGEYPVPVVMTRELADSVFGDVSQAVGKTCYNPYYLMANISTNYKVVAVVADQKPFGYSRYEKMIYMPNQPEALPYSNIVVSVKPENRATFAEKFYADMRQPLERGVFYLLGAEPLSARKEAYDLSHGTVNYLNTTYIFIAFFMFMVFLIVLGSFMMRTRRRRCEIGVRMAMGSSRRMVMLQLMGEGLLLLALALLPALVVALNIVNAHITVNTLTDMSALRFIVTFGTAALLLALVIVAAIYPSARKAMNLDPAETLHDE